MLPQIFGFKEIKTTAVLRVSKAGKIIPYGFIQAMLIVQEEYKKIFRLPPTNEIPSFKLVEDILVKRVGLESIHGYTIHDYHEFRAG